jgi:hypothetical protein
LQLYELMSTFSITFLLKSWMECSIRMLLWPFYEKNSSSGTMFLSKDFSVSCLNRTCHSLEDRSDSDRLRVCLWFCFSCSSWPGNQI